MGAAYAIPQPAGPPSASAEVIAVTGGRDLPPPSLCSLAAIIQPMPDEKPFVPRGAVAFFGAMIVFYAAIWLLLMAVMVARR